MLSSNSQGPDRCLPVMQPDASNALVWYSGGMAQRWELLSELAVFLARLEDAEFVTVSHVETAVVITEANDFGEPRPHAGGVGAIATAEASPVPLPAHAATTDAAPAVMHTSLRDTKRLRPTRRRGARPHPGLGMTARHGGWLALGAACVAAVFTVTHLPVNQSRMSSGSLTRLSQKRLPGGLPASGPPRPGVPAPAGLAAPAKPATRSPAQVLQAAQFPGLPQASPRLPQASMVKQALAPLALALNGDRPTPPASGLAALPWISSSSTLKLPIPLATVQPVSVLPHVIVSYLRDDVAAKRSGTQMTRDLRVAGYEVDDPTPVTRATRQPSISYFFQKDAAVATVLARQLWREDVQPRLAGMPLASLPRPGTLFIMIPASETAAASSRSRGSLPRHRGIRHCDTVTISTSAHACHRR